MHDQPDQFEDRVLTYEYEVSPTLRKHIQQAAALGIPFPTSVLARLRYVYACCVSCKTGEVLQSVAAINPTPGIRADYPLFVCHNPACEDYLPF